MSNNSSTGQKHPYHLVDPSPLPFLSSIAGLAMAVGLVFYMHYETKWLLILGTIGLLTVMFLWWKDVIKESTEIVNNVIIDNLVEKLEYKDNILTGLYNIKDLYVLRYKNVLKTLLAKKYIIISNKTLNDLIEYINRYILTNKERVFILNKYNTIAFKNTNDNSYKKLIITYLSNE